MILKFSRGNGALSGDVTTASCQNLNIDPNRTASPKEVPSFFFFFFVVVVAGVVFFFWWQLKVLEEVSTNGHRHLEDSISSICGCFFWCSNKDGALTEAFCFLGGWNMNCQRSPAAEFLLLHKVKGPLFLEVMVCEAKYVTPQNKLCQAGSCSLDGPC